MAKHRKPRNKYNGRGKHRAVPPKRDIDKARAAVVLPLTVSMVLYPAIVGDDEGRFGIPNIGAIIPIMEPPTADAREVIPDPTEIVPTPVVDLGSPAG